MGPSSEAYQYTRDRFFSRSKRADNHEGLRGGDTDLVPSSISSWKRNAERVPEPRIPPFSNDWNIWRCITKRQAHGHEAIRLKLKWTELESVCPILGEPGVLSRESSKKSNPFRSAVSPSPLKAGRSGALRVPIPSTFSIVQTFKSGVYM